MPTQDPGQPLAAAQPAGQGSQPTTHGAHRPGHRSQGHSGRRPCRAHRCRCSGRSTPGGRPRRSAQGDRLGRGQDSPSGTDPGDPAARPAHGSPGPHKGPQALLPWGHAGPLPSPRLALPSVHCSWGRPLAPLTHPARSAAPSSPGGRSSCHWWRGTRLRACRCTGAHSLRQTGSGGSLGAERGLLGCGQGQTGRPRSCTGSPALNRGFLDAPC